MTKKDQKSIALGALFGLLGGVGIYFFFSRVKKIPEINPAIVKWDSP